MANSENVSDGSGSGSNEKHSTDETISDSTSNEPVSSSNLEEDNIEEVILDDESCSVTSTSSNGKKIKKFLGDKAMLAEAQKMYPSNSEMKRSERIQAKKRKRYNDGRTTILATDFENCDCLMPECKGCHGPCRRCGDRRCGLDCRRGRRWVYQSVEIDGRNIELFNPHHPDNE